MAEHESLLNGPFRMSVEDGTSTASQQRQFVAANTSRPCRPSEPQRPAIILREIMSVHFREEDVDGIRYVFPTNRFYAGSDDDVLKQLEQAGAGYR